MSSAVKPKPKTNDGLPRVGALEAKTNLARLLRGARAGQRVVITQRGRPVALLAPIEEDAPTKAGAWSDMKEKIWIADDF